MFRLRRKERYDVMVTYKDNDTNEIVTKRMDLLGYSNFAMYEYVGDYEILKTERVYR